MQVSVIIAADTVGRRDSREVEKHIRSVLPHAEIIISRGDVDPYNKGRVFNRGAALAQGDVLLFVDCDVIHHPNVLRRASVVEKWGIPSGPVHNLLSGEALGGKHVTRPGRVPWRGGLFAFRRAYFVPWDEEFEGWGREDHAHYIETSRRLGEPEDLGAEPTWHLYHEAQPDKHKDRNIARFREVAGRKGYRPMRVRVENVSRATVARAGSVFPGHSAVEVDVPGDYQYKQLKACISLRVTRLDEQMTTAEPDLGTLAFSELRKLASGLKLQDVRKMKKAELIKAIREAKA